MQQYKSMVDFTNKDEKNNYKWVEQFLKNQKKRHPEEDNISFLLDLIRIHQSFIKRRKEVV